MARLTTSRFIVAAITLLTMFPGASRAQKVTSVTVYVVKNLLSSPHFVALENGFSAEQGLNVTIKLTSGGRNVVQALRAGDAQFGHVAISGTLSAALAGETSRMASRLLACPGRNGTEQSTA